MRSPNARMSLKSAHRISLKAATGKLRVLIADDDRAVARGLGNYFSTHGFECKIVSTVADAKEAIEFWHPDTVFIDLMLPSSNALSLLRFLNTHNLKKKPETVVMSRQAFPDVIAQAKKAGANHYLVKPFSNEDAFQAVMANRLKEQPSQPKAETPVAPKPSMLTELHLLNLILKQAVQPGAAPHERHYNLMRMISLKTKAMRCSLVHCVNDDTGQVTASNDDVGVDGLPLDLRNYPEIQEVRRTLRPMMIPDIRESDLLAPVKGRLAQTPFEMIALFPVYTGGRFWGVLSLRTGQRNSVDRSYIEKFGEVCAQILSLSLVA